MLHKMLHLVAVLLLLTLGAASAEAQTPSSQDGVIVFSRADANGHYGLFTIAPGTRQPRRLTRGCGWDWFPAWSPDGRRIAFSRACRNTSGLDLYVVGANGKGLRRLVHTRTNDLWPSWSPDGSKIAFVSGEPPMTKPGQRGIDPELWVVGVNGHGLKRLSNNNVRDETPAWSPDGKWIAFFSSRRGHKGLWIIGGDGRRAHPLGITGGEPAWSPDGTQLAFAHARSGVGRETVDLYIANADGSGIKRMTHERVGVVSHHPSWSADGHSIVYMSRTSLWIIGVNDGGVGHRLTRSPMEDADPDWSKPAQAGLNQ